MAMQLFKPFTTLYIALQLAGCAHDKADPKQDPAEAPPEVLAAFQETADRLLTDTFTPGGWVLSRRGDAEEHHGDSLIWTGMALGVLPCDKAPKVETALLAMLEAADGGLYRHPTKPDDVSQDGALGFYWGVAHYLTRCPDRLDAWREPLARHAALGDFQLNRNSTAQIYPEYDLARDSLFYFAGVGPQPDSGRLDTLGKEVAGSAFLVKLANRTGQDADGCFRVHIGLLALETVAVLGQELGGETRGRLCEEATGIGLETMDAYCGKWGPLMAYLDAFQYDQWEMAFQRCDWESPDGGGNLKTPAIDRLVGLRARFRL